MVWQLINILRKLFQYFCRKLIFSNSRNRAHQLRKKVVQVKGYKTLNKRILKEIKKYARERFGTKAYWPYLALYTEIRGKFIEGWIPQDYYSIVLLPALNPKPAVYMNNLKTYDYRLFEDFALVPLILVVSGIFFDASLKPLGREQLKKLLSDYNDIMVIKEEGGRGGMQIKILHSLDFNPEELKKNTNYVVQPYIKQYKVLNDLYPESVNTFRITTFLRKDGSVKILFVILRFGTNGLRIDNLSSGGHYLYFSLDGKPENAVYEQYTGVEIGRRHVNTGFIFSVIEIPMFKLMLEKCKNAHKKFPYTRLVGWDVCIDSTGKPILLEWNTEDVGFYPFEAKFGPFFPENDVLC